MERNRPAGYPAPAVWLRRKGGELPFDLGQQVVLNTIWQRMDDALPDAGRHLLRALLETERALYSDASREVAVVEQRLKPLDHGLCAAQVARGSDAHAHFEHVAPLLDGCCRRAALLERARDEVGHVVGSQTEVGPAVDLDARTAVAVLQAERRLEVDA